MTHQELSYMYGLQRFGIQPGLSVMQQMMNLLGNPETSFKSVHIAGTNGKGSTASFIASIVQEAGLQVGLYTSPHLVKFNERIQINRIPISDEELSQFVQEVRQLVETANIQPTFFEFTTAIAFLYFARTQVDIAVIETGMGGRLDATNVIAPLVSVITTIGLDHTQFLGTSETQIAAEKAGIIKPDVPAVVGYVTGEPYEVIRTKAEKEQAPLHSVEQELSVTSEEQSLTGQSFTTRGVVEGSWHISLLGDYQQHNAATALLATEYIATAGISISQEARMKGLQKATWPGRMELLSQAPYVLIDGAHNEDGAKVLYEFLQQFSRHETLILALKKDKEATYMIQNIVPLFSRVIVTEGSYEPYPAQELQALVSPYAKQAECIPKAGQAARAGLTHTSPQGLLLVTGSLYMIGEAREELLRALS